MASTANPDSTSTGSLPELPWAFIACPTDTLVILISHMLNLLINHNDQVVLTPDSLTRFHSRAAPGITVIDYLRRIVKYTNVEIIPLLSLLSYIDITCTHLPDFTLSSLTVHRFLIAGVCAGSKAQCDVFCTNAHYAKVGGIKVEELNALEREFLKVTKWDLCCNSELLQRYYSSLIRSHGGYTQAPEPASVPFIDFPRSASKPDLAQVAETAPADAPQPEIDQDMMDELTSTSTSINAHASSSTSTSPTTQRGRPRRRPSGSSNTTQPPMEVDVAEGEGDEPEVDPRYTGGSMVKSSIRSIRSSASSSIPASSRSRSSSSSRDPDGGGDEQTSTIPGIVSEREQNGGTRGESQSQSTDPSAGGGGGGGKDDEHGESDPSPVASHGNGNGNGHGHGHPGRALKNMIGGIFKRAEHPHSLSHSHSQAQAQGQTHPTRVIANLPPSPATAPKSAIKSPAILAGMGMGMAKPVTPRIRSRSERSVEGAALSTGM